MPTANSLPPTWLKRALGPEAYQAYALASVADALGMELYLVGGAVRDWLRPRLTEPTRPRDVDLMVVGDARTLVEHASLRLGGDLMRYSERFLTARYRMARGATLDIATARTEIYRAPGALPTVSPASAAADLTRRDISINALAVRIQPGLPDASPPILDPTGGLEDLTRGRLRALHSQSFTDDPTRIYRILRFATRLAFQIEAQTEEWLKEALAANVLDTLSPERRGQELAHCWAEPRPDRLAEQLLAFGVPDPLLDEIGQLRRPDLLARALSTSCEAFATFGASMPGLLMSHLGWLSVALNASPPVRQAGARLVAPTSGALSLWFEGPGRVLAARDACRGADRGQLAAILRPLHPAERALLAPPEATVLRQEILWYETEGRHLRTVVTARMLLTRGVSRGPAIGEALLAAQLAAWRGACEDAQWQAALSSPSKAGS